MAGTHVENKKSGKGRGGIIIAVAALLLCAALLALWLMFVFVGGGLVSRSAAEVDLNGAGVNNVARLLRLKNPEKIDLRGCDVSAEDYDAMAEAFPGCEILWDVPLGGVGEVYDSLSESVAVPVYHPEKAELYALMPNLREIDLRDAVLSAAEFEELQKALPDCRIIWSIPMAGQYFDSSAESITLGEFSLEDAEMLVYFENLKTLDASQSDSYMSCLRAEELLPDCDVRWSISLGGESFEPDAELVGLVGNPVTAAELHEKLAYFSAAKTVSLGETSLCREEITALREAFPDISFEHTVIIGEHQALNVWDKLAFAGEQNVDADALIAAAWAFTALEEIDLRECGLGAEELIAIAEAYPGVFIRADAELYGAVFPTDAEEIDLSGIEISDTSLIENALVLFPNLKKVIMSDCGISDEDMDALDLRHEDVHFVWTLHFSVYDVRTDVTAFCASNVPGYVAPKLGDYDLAPIKYLRQLEALDLGHMYYTDLSFLENMPKLRYLILVEANYRDISAIAGLENLYYLELFNNTIEDISPLLECKNLRHLNIGFTRGHDASVLKEMTWLERLWYPGSPLSQDEIADIEAALPDVETYFVIWDGDGSTGGGWREHESYFEMRDLFDMHYMPGGTGVPGAEE